MQIMSKSPLLQPQVQKAQEKQGKYTKHFEYENHVAMSSKMKSN